MCLNRKTNRVGNRVRLVGVGNVEGVGNGVGWVVNPTISINFVNVGFATQPT